MSSWKEPKYFMVDSRGAYASGTPLAKMITDWDSYMELFAHAGSARAVGEASVMYLSSYFPERTAYQIKERLPHAKLIAVLRHPADRAYSAYTFFRSRNFESLESFNEALAAEEERVRINTQPDLFYRRNGLYGEHLEKFFAHFPKDQIKVFLYEEWSECPQKVLREIFSFLEVEINVTITPMKRAVTMIPKSRSTAKAIKALSQLLALLFPRLGRRTARYLFKLNSTRPPPLEPELRNQLIDYFEQDIQKLQKIISQDLSHWLIRSPITRS